MLRYLLSIINKVVIWFNDIIIEEKRIKIYECELKKYGRECIKCNVKYIYKVNNYYCLKYCFDCYKLKVCIDCNEYNDNINEYKKRCY